MAPGPPMPMPMPPSKPAAPNGEPDLPKTDPPLKMPFGLPVWMGPRFVSVCGRFVIGPMGSPVVQLGFGNGS